jgi:hypothetical protein
MGYDTSFHAIDLGLVQTRLLPFIAGQGSEHDLDDLLAQAVALRKVRFRAKAWALGALSAARARGIDGLDPSIHVWGRPFFVVADGADEVVEAVLAWLATPLDEVDSRAKQMADRLAPGLGDAIEPDTGGHLPADENLRAGFIGRLKLLRAATGAARAGARTVRAAPNGKEYDAVGLLAREVPFSVLLLASELTPGWMSRGPTWPTRLYEKAGLSPENFSAPHPLYALLRDSLPSVDWFAESTITQNYMVGGLVRPEQVAAARVGLATQHDELLAPASAEGWGDSCAKELTKIDESLALAARLGLGFCEATEIYSGFEGDLN